MDIWFDVTNDPLTHSQTIKNSATQLLRSWSGALATQKVFVFVQTTLITPLFAGDRDSSYDDYLNDLQKGGDGECRFVSSSCQKATSCHKTTSCHKAYN